ncbi:MAG: hypothetical protein CL610_04270 [Anaerolineaceae bacterium]|nr:hypothetical protein [Anaerolineaceae bacterium]
MSHMLNHHDQAGLFQNLVLSVGTVLDLKSLLKQLAAQVNIHLPASQCLILVADEDDPVLRFGALHPAPSDTRTQQMLESLSLGLFNSSSPIIADWIAGNPFTLTAENTADQPELGWLLTMMAVDEVVGQPLMNRDELVGVILLALNEEGGEALESRLAAVTAAGALTIQNARIYSRTVHQAEAHMRELTILRQIDRELNDTIEPHHVFQMTLDWALRFTNAQAASIGLYDQETDELRIITTYGYDTSLEELQYLRAQSSSIAHRVARSGRAEIIPNVADDKDYIRGANQTQSQLSVPIRREDRVISVISVESKKLNGFSDEHLDFVEKLAARAGVAIDNARLFDTTAREREKLSHILNNTADVVIVLGLDERLILINPAAFSALRLYPYENYVGRRFEEIFPNTPLMDAYKRAQNGTDPLVEEVEVASGRIFHMNVTTQENVGRIIVMHDITPFKEMDRLKSELIATVSHDLKQPLAVMNGYIELLLMHRKLDENGLGFLDMVRKSIQSMRQLIDDLLDLAKIESGIQLNMEPVDVKSLVDDCLESLQPNILGKALRVVADIPDDLPFLLADRARFQQILLNLTSNAVKYTQTDGEIQIRAEHRDKMVHIVVKDNGMGISAEDQTHIFERFYRVRRPETDNIEGTGLGLAIVKSLVEAHKGQIGLESRLGEGTQFFLKLPVAVDDPTVVSA